MSFILVQIILLWRHCPVEYFISENYLANIHVANVAYVTTTIYKFKTCKNSYNSQSCKLSALESIKNTWTWKTVLNLGEFLQVQKIAPNGTINWYLDCRFVIKYINPLPPHMPQSTTNKQPPHPIFAHANHKG